MTNMMQQDLWENRLFRRGLAIAILGLLIGGVIWGLLTSYLESQSSLTQLEKMQARYDQAIGSEGSLRQRLEDLQGAEVKSDALLSGESVALVGAQLQARLKQIIREAGGRLETTQMLSSEQDASLEKIMVRASMSVSTKTLQKILYVLETQRPYLFIDQLDIKTFIQRRAVDKAQTESLKVTIDFYGYRKLGGGA